MSVLDASADQQHEHSRKFPLLDDQEFKRNGLPYNKSFEVRNSTVCAGFGLFTRPGITIEPYTHIAYYGGELLSADGVTERYGDDKPRYLMRICDDHSRDARDDLASLGRYINTDPNHNNARIVPCVGDSKAGRYSARYVSTSRIGPSTEVLGAYGPSASRAARSHASVSSSDASALRRSQRLPAVSEPSITLSVHSSTPLPTTSMSDPHDDSSDMFSHTDSIASTSPLVHPYQEALAKSKQSTVTSFSTSSSSLPAVPAHQWKQFHDRLFEKVLLPNSRHEHMTQIVASTDQDQKTSTGRYLNVFDAHTHHDIVTPHMNIIQQLLQENNKPHRRSTSTQSSSSSSSSPAQRLRQIISTNASYKQEAYCQHSVTGPDPPPVVEGTVIPHGEACERLIKASETTSSFTSTTTEQRAPQQQNIFMPFINIDSIKNDTLQQRIKAVAAAVQQLYKSRTVAKHLEIECDHAFATPLDGFGIDGVQLYLKSGECVTWLHDELLWCSALNYMMRESIGCSLWIAIGLHDLKQVMSVSEIDAVFRRPQTKTDIMNIGALLDTLVEKKVYMEYVIQQPGQGVSSPPGAGAAHLVYADGILMSQLAWNYSFTMPGAIDCLAFWGGHENTHGHLSLSNGSMATRSVLPLYSMQENGYDFNLADQMKLYQDFISRLKYTYPQRRYRITRNPDTRLPHCKQCLFRQDWIRINNQCIHCYYKKHVHEIK
jgi:hypothetical protein